MGFSFLPSLIITLHSRLIFKEKHILSLNFISRCFELFSILFLSTTTFYPHETDTEVDCLISVSPKVKYKNIHHFRHFVHEFMYLISIQDCCLAATLYYTETLPYFFAEESIKVLRHAIYCVISCCDHDNNDIHEE